MNLSNIWPRVQGRYQRTVSEIFFKRPLVMQNTLPYISFTFDDFPRSSLHAGGKILLRYGLRGTYYASFGLMSKEAPTGEIFTSDDIKELIAQGHELGCHTFSHCNAWETSPSVFEDSIKKNRQALDALVHGTTFRSSSYPIIGPRAGTKLRTSRYFDCCRCGGQTFNVGRIDLNLLKAFFLEKKRDNPLYIKDLIDINSAARGWLIFATHDVSESPTSYGCTPAFFEEIVKYSKDSGSRILPVARALDEIKECSPSERIVNK